MSFYVALGIFSFVACFAFRALAIKFGVIDKPTGGRKIHKQPTPLWGGLGIGVTLVLFILFYAYVVRGELYWEWSNPFVVQLVGFAGSIFILMIGGALDDRFDLPPVAQFSFILTACLLSVLTGTNVSKITNWFGGAPIELGMVGSILAFIWLLFVTMAMKFMDGLDGLVTGQTVIGASLIALLATTTMYRQSDVADLAVAVAVIFLAFLPLNFHPARHFLGESGATIAGFSLGFLSILGGAKLATGLMALGFPLMDALFVVIGRLSRGVSPFKGDDTHLHFKLLRAGLSQRQTVLLIWGLSAATGAVALSLQSVGKAALVAWIAFVVLGLSAWAGWRNKRSSLNV